MKKFAKLRSAIDIFYFRRILGNQIKELDLTTSTFLSMKIYYLLYTYEATNIRISNFDTYIYG